MCAKKHYNLQFLLTRQNDSKIKIVNCKSKFHSHPKHQLHRGPTRKLFCSAAARFDASSCISRATAKHKLCQKNENNEFKTPTRGARSDSHAHAPKCEASSPRATITHTEHACEPRGSAIFHTCQRRFCWESCLLKMN